MTVPGGERPGTGSEQPRSIGELAVAVVARDGVTHLSDLRQSGAMKALFPTPRGPAVTAVAINTGGGIAGGDRFRLKARAGVGASLAITTQAAERVYRAAGAVPGAVANDLVVEEGASLHWMPQETILFDGARLRRRLTVEMAATARVLLVEPLVFGRGARGETIRAGAYSDRILLRRDGREIYRDGCEMAGAITGAMAGPAVGGGAGAMAQVVLAADGAEGRLARVRDLLPATAGASAPRAGLLVVRMVAGDAFSLRRILIPVIECLSNIPLPPVWRF